MFQFAFVASLFTFRARNPQMTSLLQLPKRMATALKTQTSSPIKFSFVNYQRGRTPAPPYGVSGDTPAGGNRSKEAPMLQYATAAA